MNSVELKQGFILAACAGIAVAVIVVTYHATRNTIRQTNQRELEAQLVSLLEPESYNNTPALDTIEIAAAALGTNEPKTIYRARLNGQPSGAVISAVAPDGYNGDIGLLIGLNYEGVIVGARVTGHKETPGLGDDIDVARSDWILAFENLQPKNMQASEWQVKKEGGRFDQFTGATITPRAVVQAVYRVATWYKKERKQLFKINTSVKSHSDAAHSETQ